MAQRKGQQTEMPNFSPAFSKESVLFSKTQEFGPWVQNSSFTRRNPQTDFSPESLGKDPLSAHTLNLCFWPSELRGKKFLLSQATKFLVTCYSSPGKLIPVCSDFKNRGH
jgi:hypothetical protein